MTALAITDEVRRNAERFREAMRGIANQRDAFPDQCTWIYAIQAGEAGPIKIGVARNPDERLATLQVGSPEPLRGVIAWWAPIALEKALHETFADLRIRGEWFEPAPDLLNTLEVLGFPWTFYEGDWTP